MTEGVTKAPMPDAPTCRARYEKLATERDPYLRRARDAARLTIPSIMPEEGVSGATDLPAPFQSCGAEGVNSLASKLQLALLPPGGSFFRLTLDESVKAQLQGASDGDITGEIEKNLGQIEKAALNRVEQRGWRVSKFDALKHLLVCGNVLMEMKEDESLRIHYLNNYVVKRDPVGNVLEIITVEKIAKVALPEKARALVIQDELNDEEFKNQEAVSVYTRVYREESSFKVYQEICGQTVPDSEGSYPLDKSPWMPLRYCKVDGQDYGRGRVEEWLGDFESLEALTQSIVEGSAAMAKILFLVDEGGLTDVKKVAEAKNCEFVEGRAKDIEVLQVQKTGDFTVAQSLRQTLETRLKQAFLVHQQRDAERVTAEEVRAIIDELEKALGGLYSILAQEWQGPAVRRLLFQMQKRREIQPLDEDVIEPKIITGLDALGRTADYQKLRAFVSDIATELGQDVVKEYIDISDYLVQKAAALQLSIKIRSDEEVQQSRQEQAKQELLTKMGPQALKTEGDMAMASQQSQPAPSQ